MLHAVLMPLKCTAANPPSMWLERLKQSNLHRKDVRLYVGVDADDLLWQQAHCAEANALLEFVEIVSPDDQPPGAVCNVWRRLAQHAVSDGCNGALILFGDDVTYHASNPGWLLDIADVMSAKPLVLFHPVDTTDESVCTFPIVSAEHIRLFDALFPPCFRNQGADPFLHELYRRVDRVRVLEGVRVENARGGPVKRWPGRAERPAPAYKPEHVCCSHDTMDEWAKKLALAVEWDHLSVGSIDVLVPTFRCDVSYLREIQVAVARVSRARLIIQVDDPESVHLQEVLSLEAYHTRVRVNPTNMGAPSTRNQLLKEATASTVLFLDDDVIPHLDVVEQYLASMLSSSGRSLCGLVGRVIFPESPDVWHEATRMSGITLAFDWPDDVFPGNLVPWGVTASLCLWRKHAVDFDVQYARTGGGEDVDFCLRVSRQAGMKWGKASSAVVEHPFWKRQPGAKGLSCYLGHFFKWTQGDGLLLDRFPELVYLNLPNVIELSLMIVLVWGMRAFCCLWAVELAAEAHDSWVGPHARHLCTIDRAFAALLSGIVKNVVDFGHTFYFLRRGRFDMCVGRRFDWFCGMTDDVKRGERRKFLLRWLAWVAIICVGR